MADRLTGMEVFVRAMTDGSLSAASRNLGISPAMATKHLDALERRLGVTLVQRTTRKLSLTEAGRHFLEESKRLLAELAGAEAAASARTIAVEGLLRVAVPVSLGILNIAPILPGFSQRYPSLTIELGLNDRFVDLMEEGWDIAVRAGHLRDSLLIARKLAPVTAVICASPSYLKIHGVPKTLDDLQSHVCLGYTLSANGGGRVWRFGRGGDIHVPIRGVLFADNGDALVAAAAAGQGLVYGPRFIAAPALADGRLEIVELDAPLVDLGAIYAVTHPNRRPAAKTRAWIDYLVEEIPKQKFSLSG
uniref:HTH-type transcriptional regulator TtuA n=1 Tax=Agrobacterium albertimagni TaxID=147266 RepID=A0A7C1NVG5_9HYPH